MLKYLLVLFLLVGCFKWHPSSITCYSNGHKIYEGTAIGRIVFRDGSWEFIDHRNKWMRVSGNCVVQYNE